MSKARWSLRYLWLKIADAHRATELKWRALDGSAAPQEEAGKVMDQLSEVFAKTFMGRTTEVIKFAGPSMVPTLNRNASTDPSQFELLILRKLRSPSELNVRVGDVVAFSNPGVSSGDSLMVRRVLGIPGDVLSDDNDVEHVLDPGVCWVTADNEALAPPNVEDSRSFGPLPMQDIQGRVIYSIRTPSDHGAVENSKTSQSDDYPFLEVEVPDILSEPELFESQTKPDPPVKEDAP